MSGGNSRNITYTEIAHKLGLSRERVCQIAKQAKLNKRFKSNIKPRINKFSNNYTEPMLTTREVANLLNLHVNTVRRWSNKGILMAYRISPRGDMRFKQPDVDSLLTKVPGESRTKNDEYQKRS